MEATQSHQLSRVTKPVLKRWSILAVLLVGLAGCASTEDKLESAFIEANNVSESEANCVVTELISTYGTDGVEQQLSAIQPDEKFLADQGKAMAKCDVVVITMPELKDAFMKANPNATSAEAECVIESLMDKLGTPALIENLWLDPPPADFELTQFETMFECGIDETVREALVVQLVEQGTASDKAPCVSDRIVEQLEVEDLQVLLTGENTDEFYNKYFSALQACGAVTN